MKYDSLAIQQQANRERSEYLGQLIVDGLFWIGRTLRKMFRRVV